jgi:hypothetical protein
MGVDINKARGNNLAGRIKFLAALGADLANRSYDATVDRNIGDDKRRAGAINDSSTPNNKIMHADSPIPSEGSLSSLIGQLNRYVFAFHETWQCHDNALP